MKTTVYIVYLKAIEGRFALPEEETTERNLLAHHFGRNFTNYGLLTKDQLKFKLRQYTQVIKQDTVVGKVKPDSPKESYTRKQAKLEVYGEKGLSFELIGLQYKTMEVKYDEDCNDYLYRVVNIDNGDETFFWQNFLKKNITRYWLNKMTLFQFLTAWHANGLISTEMYLERLKELKATKEKELEEVVTAINLNSPKKEIGVSSKGVDPMFKVGQKLMFKDGHTETVLEVRYSMIINSYCYRTDKNSGFDSESAIKNELDGTFRNIVSIKSKP